MQFYGLIDMNGSESRLLTILAADVAEYSRHVDEDEEGALASLDELRRKIDETLTRFGGRLANTAGDGFIAAFESAVSSVLAAVELQRSVGELPPLKSGEKLQLRIGINLGEVRVTSSGDVLGHGVNVAARLEGLARVGGICLSDSVEKHLRGRVNFELTKSGEHYLKNISEPIQVYSVGNEASPWKDFTRLVKHRSKNPITQLFLAVSAAAVVALFLSPKANTENPDSGSILFENIVKTSNSIEKLISHFPLVTRGDFNGSKYYIIQSWGGSLMEIVSVADFMGGHLATIGSQAENDFLFELSTSEMKHWSFIAGEWNGPVFGLIQEEGADEPAGGWVWQNGEPVVYENWKKYGPDNAGGNQSLAHFKGRKSPSPSPKWNDIPNVQNSFIVEVPTGQ